MSSPTKSYFQWIADNVGRDPYGQCEEITKRMAGAFPELQRQRGHYVCPSTGRQPHWWLVTPDGTVLDRTKDQFPSRGLGAYELYEGPEPTGTCLTCGALVFGDERFCNAHCRNEFVEYLKSEVE